MTDPRQKLGRKVAVSVLFDTVTIEVICGDDYLAQVTYDDIVDRLRRGEGLTLQLEHATAGGRATGLQT